MCLFCHYITHPFQPSLQWQSFSLLWHPAKNTSNIAISSTAQRYQKLKNTKFLWSYKSQWNVWICIASQTCWANLCEPIAIVTERTVGIAIGMPPINSTRRLSIPFRYFFLWIPYITMISKIIPTAIEQMQKFPIDVRTCNNYVMSLSIILTIFHMEMNVLETENIHSHNIKETKNPIYEPFGNVQHVLCFPQDELPFQKRCELQLQ